MVDIRYNFCDYHESREASFTLQPGIKVKTTVFEGDYKMLEGFAKNLVVGRHPGHISSSDLPGLDKEFYIAGLQLARTNGKRARMAVTLSLQQNVKVWGLEMAEIQKPIKTWMSQSTNALDRPDLNLLSNWESQAGKPGLESDYNAYIYQGQPLTVNTLELAKMIREQGIDHYVVYTPVITCTSRCNEIPADIGKDTGKIVTTFSDNQAPIDTLKVLANEWLKTTDRIQGAIDGTYTRTQQWTGADKWNAKLYEKSTNITN